MYPGSNARRNLSSQQYDQRNSSAPQTIPQNPGIQQHQRSYAPQGGNRSYPGSYSSPAQSPRQTFFAPPISQSDMNIGLSGTPSSMGNPHTNGGQQGQPIFYQRPQYNQQSYGMQQPTQVTKYSPMPNPNQQFVPGMHHQNTPPPNIMTPNPYIYVPPNRFISPSGQNIVPAQQTHMPAASPTYYHQGQFFQSPLQTYDAHGMVQQPQYQPPHVQQPHIQTTPQQPTPTAAAPQKRKGIVIKDPTTGQEVTNEFLADASATKKGEKSPVIQPATTPVPPPAATQNQELIAAKFAAQVAAAASSSAATASNTTSTTDSTPVPTALVTSLIPDGIDTSKPPPPLQAASNIVAPNIAYTPRPVLGGPQLAQHKDAPVAVVNPIKVGIPHVEPCVTKAASIEKKTEKMGAGEEKKKEESAPDIIGELKKNKENLIKSGDAPRPEERKPEVEPVEKPTDDVVEIILEETEVADEVDGKPDEPEPVVAEAKEPETPSVQDVAPAQIEDKSADVEDVRVDVPVINVIEATPVSAPPKENVREFPLPPTPKAEIFAPETAPAVVTRGESPIVDGKGDDLEKVVKPVATDAKKTPEKPAEIKDIPKPEVKPVAPVTPKKEEKIASKPLNNTAPAPVVSNVQGAEDEDTKGGKKVYDRQFLMEFRYQTASLLKPKDLPVIEDIIMDKANPRQPRRKPLPKNVSNHAMPNFQDMSRGGGTDFAPKYMGNTGGGRSQSRGMRDNRGSRDNYGSMGQNYPSTPRQSGGVKKISIQREPELKRAENAWKPSKLDTTQDNKSPDEIKTYEIFKNIRSILNKLTPQNFSALMQKVQALDINTELRLRGVIDLIFEKAIEEPNFSEAYANMCRIMSTCRVEGKNTLEFRKILLTRCQREFEKEKTNEAILGELRLKLENATKEDEKKQFKEELDLAVANERRRTFGNIRFIGELFKLTMLTESIMHNCIMSLFQHHDEDSLESLCRLLTTIGKLLDHEKGSERMKQYFTQMEKIVREKKTSSRVRFMILDVIDLRSKKWVPRAIKSQGPKTIDQIHKDIEKEKEATALSVAAISLPPSKQQPRGNRLGSRGRSGPDLSDGWTKVGQQVKPMRYDPQKMKLSKQQFDEANVTLGPSSRKTWKTGSGSAATKSGSGSYSRREPPSNEVEHTPRSSTPTLMNKFSALGNSGHESYSQRSGSRHSSREGIKSSGPPREERRAAVDSVRRMTSQEDRRPQSRDNSFTKPRPVAPAITEEQMEKKTESIIKEYLHLNDIKEASECFDEIKSPASLFHVFPKVAMNVALEKSAKDRHNVARLVNHFLKSKKIANEHFYKGFADVLVLAADLELDLPRVWTCVAELFGPVLHSSENRVEFDSLHPLSRPLLELKKAGVFVAEVLSYLIKNMPFDQVLEKWQSANLHWSLFMPSADETSITNLLEKHNLQSFSMLGNGSTTLPSINITVDEIRKQLDMKKSDDDIFDWVEANFDAEKRATPQFIRALTTALCQQAIKQGDNDVEVDASVIRSRLLVFKKFIDDDEKELQAVYALQSLYIQLEQPPNILKLLFNLLYVEDVIQEQAFLKWETDTNEEEGRGVAVLSVKPFLTWLREAEPESD